ncbi:Uma2 family endonuclease [Iningainema tapete]|uniref:Uma2 family endonuclease n=1 Tax=Iningainema tapete BLCC-T55 TaxID=2748662 RepID=A0A8J6XKW6_9CYAN|nr:Uma2 family endonuclease [Iningainema tapete]MBD2776603.1 Uma2 family endonuclease [Iningainema tapete BLCC-T55]
MTQAARRLTFEEYLALEDKSDLPEERCEFVDGELVLPPESEVSDFIARYLLFVLASSGVVSLRLITIHTCELQVPMLKPKTPQNQYPDLVILREEHLALTKARLTITMDMLPPTLVVEVVSPGETARERDYKDKREQYEARGIPEYWLIDPQQQSVMVLGLIGGKYSEIGTFCGSERIYSPTFGDLQLTAQQIFTAGSLG